MNIFIVLKNDKFNAWYPVSCTAVSGQLIFPLYISYPDNFLPKFPVSC